MTILFVLVPLALVLCVLAVWAFFWAVNTGQFEDMDAASASPLEDDLSRQPEADDPAVPAPRPSAPDGRPSG